jgi:hypothetical protein
MSLHIVTHDPIFLLPKDVTGYVMQFVEFADICRSSEVCKLWNQALESNCIWIHQYEKNGIPRVAGQNRNLKNDFKILYPITLSGKTIQKYFGKIDGKLPHIDPKKFDALVNQDDPWESGTKMHETFQVVVSPAYIIRPFDTLLVDLLTEKGDAAEILPVTESNSTPEVKIPFGVKNRELLVRCLDTIRTHKNGPIIKSYLPNLLNQCSNPAKNTISFMRKEVVAQNFSYVDKKKHVEDRNLEVISLGDRLLADTIAILESGTCSDSRKEGDCIGTFAVTSTIRKNKDVISIGDFTLGRGLLLMFSSIIDSDDINGVDIFGVVPGVSAEVQSSANEKDN